MKKILALLLTAALIAGCAPGTAGTTEDTADSSTTTEAQAEPDSSEEESEPADETEVPDGELYEHTFPIVDEKQTYTAVSWAEFNVNGKWNEYWEDATNIHIDWTYWPATDFDTNYATSLAGETIPDLFFLSGRDKRAAHDAGSAGTFVDYNDYLHLMPYLQELAEEFPEIWPTITHNDGTIYGLPQVAMTLTAQPGVIYYRTDMMEEAGVDVPETTDEFLEAVADLQEHFEDDRDNFIAFQVHTSGHMSHAEHFFFPSFGDAVDPGFAADEQGNVVYNYISEQFRNYLEFMNELYDGPGFDQNVYTEDGTNARARILENNAVISTLGTVYADSNFEGDSYDVDVIAPLTSEYSSEQRYRKPDVVRYGFMHISSQVEDVETLVKWLDTLYAPRDKPIDDGLWAISPWIGREGDDWIYTDEEEGLYEITPPDDWTESPTAYINTIGSGNAMGYGNFLGLNTGNIGLQIKGIGTRDKLVPYGVDPYPENYLNFDDSESRVLAEVYPDILNHTETERAKFITGQRDLSEFDDFISEIERMGLAEVLEAHQAAYDRYVNGN